MGNATADRPSSSSSSRDASPEPHLQLSSPFLSSMLASCLPLHLDSIQRCSLPLSPSPVSPATCSFLSLAGGNSSCVVSPSDAPSFLPYSLSRSRSLSRSLSYSTPPLLRFPCCSSSYSLPRSLCRDSQLTSLVSSLFLPLSASLHRHR